MKRKKNHRLFRLRYAFLILAIVIVNQLLFFFWVSLDRQKDEVSIDFKRQDMQNDIHHFRGKLSSYQTIASFFRTLTQTKGPAYAFQVLKFADLPPNTDTHLLGHVVGDVLFAKQGIEGMKICTDDFRNACSHSIVVGALLKYGVKIIPRLSGICHKAPGGRGAYTMCFHGLGHGVLAFTDYDMPKAVDLCGQMGSKAYNNEEAVQCVGGTTMEMVSGVHDRIAWKKATLKYFTPDDPLAPCDQAFIPEPDKVMCYEYLTPHLFEAAGAQMSNPDPRYFTRAFHFCDVIEGQNQHICYSSFGKEFIGMVRAHDIRNLGNLSVPELATIYHWCTMGETEEAINGCISGTESSLYWGGEIDSQPAISFCRIVDSEQKNACYATLIAQIKYYQKNSLPGVQTCNQLPDPWKTQCVS